jgi:hypothetical protein
MSDTAGQFDSSRWESLPTEQQLYFLDLATEVLEGLDELGLETRADVVALMDALEQLVADEG